jgi:hypothetical protein
LLVAQPCRKAFDQVDLGPAIGDEAERQLRLDFDDHPARGVSLDCGGLVAAVDALRNLPVETA